MGDRAKDIGLLQALYGWMTDSGASWPQTFFDWFFADEARAAASPQAALYGRPSFAPVRAALLARTPVRPGRLSHAYFQKPEPASLVIEEVEALWDPIAASDDWSAFAAKTGHIEEARLALGL